MKQDNDYRIIYLSELINYTKQHNLFYAIPWQESLPSSVPDIVLAMDQYD